MLLSRPRKVRWFRWCFYLSPAAEGGLLACTLLSLDALDETAHFLLAAANYGRYWPKQVRTDRGKCLPPHQEDRHGAPFYIRMPNRSGPANSCRSPISSFTRSSPSSSSNYTRAK